MNNKYKLYDSFITNSKYYIEERDIDPIYNLFRQLKKLNHPSYNKLLFSHIMTYETNSMMILMNTNSAEEYYLSLRTIFKERKVGKYRLRTISALKEKFFEAIVKKTPHQWIQDITDQLLKKPLTFTQACKIANNSIPSIGEYFSFKIIDVLETSGVISLDMSFDGFRKSIPKGSMVGYITLKDGESTSPPSAETIKEYQNSNHIKEFYEHVLAHDLNLPCPHADRKLAVTEVETLLCDFRKFLKGTALPIQINLLSKELSNHGELGKLFGELIINFS